MFTWSLFSSLIFDSVIILSIIGRIIWIIIKQDLPEHSFQRERNFPRPANTLMERHLQQIPIALINELKLVAFYVSASSIFELIKGNSLRWIHLVRWVIEASSIPAIIVLAVVESYLFLMKETFDRDALPTMFMLVNVSKFILWIVMRYIEIYPSSKIKNYSILRLSYFCNMKFSD